MIQMTLDEVMEAHKKLWNGIADEVENNGFRFFETATVKDEMLIELFPDIPYTHVRFGCFLCEFSASKDSYNQYNCKACPCTIVDEGKPHVCLDGLYEQFRKAYAGQDREEAIKTAREIANLPIVNPMYKESEAES